MAKFVTFDQGKSYINTEEIVRVDQSITAMYQSQVVIYIRGDNAVKTNLPIQTVMQLIRSAN